MVFLAGLGLAVCAAELLQYLIDDPEWGKKLKKFNVTLLLSAITFFVLLLIPAVWITTHEFPLRFVWGGVGAFISLIIILLVRGKRIPVGLLPPVAIAFLLIDVSGVNILGLDFKPASAILAQGSDLIKAMPQPTPDDPWRIYSPSYSLPQQTAVYSRMELADGVDPLQLGSYARYMAAATGVPASGYSVTLPPFAGGEPSTDNSSYKPDIKLLGMLSVRYIAAQFPLDLQSTSLVGTFGRTWLYEIPDRMPRAWIQQAGTEPGDDPLPVQSFSETADQIDLKVNGPGLLVLSEVVYPGWQAWVDNTPVIIRTVGGLFRGVDLPPGNHSVLMRFQPVSVYIGGSISAILWVLMGWIFLIKKGDPFGLKI
jgi:hypothetical protein